MLHTASLAFILAGGFFGLGVALHHWTADHRAIMRALRNIDRPFSEWVR